ncbi:DEAD/DEAH box helicase [Actinospica sp. MGRD01-02]|uniref:DEAD/DEAH box helicase n=1 Tax=Actinospica acidithermotolerans TaxID=2828514 RepID=A0A941IKU4_9ACTN|nr:DEAD/DEAH box helicase [Actinospica acidithermotolerans]MBR7829302.1 DEAD/DEAH box helicase [Actinospica acidithermotolerans]
MPGSAAFELLHPVVRKWIWSHQWTQLRDAQERAAAPILTGDRDVIIAATTASGKTEAAFLPICSALLFSEDEPRSGVQALYVSPLKALINDQYGRLDNLCRDAEIPVHRWHGDVPGTQKRKLLAKPSGILLITPESLEALFVVHGTAVARIFGELHYVVIDEVHTFIGSERGAQLQSLLHRVELSARRHIPRVGLSATLGDMSAACDWLRPGNGERVEVIVARDGETEIRLQVRGILETPPEVGKKSDEGGSAVRMAADALFTTHRGNDGLVFANSRASVEQLTDLLSRRSERDRVPNEFVPHHGSLSRALREHVEARLKDRSSPITAVCTSTLEMGIDIGSVAAVSQVGPPPSVSSLRQRIGRSGRRGAPAVLRAYVIERAVTERTALVDQLRVGIFQTVAMVELLVRGWCESPDNGSLHLSTLVQQVLSLIAQHGGVTPQEAYTTLCGRGPFSNVSADVFAKFLRCLGRHDLIVQQASDGLLLLGQAGERHVNHYTFYSAFQAADEYRLLAEGRQLGSLPIGFPISEGTLIIFAGQRWKITAIDDRGKTIELVRSAGGRPPMFEGGIAPVADMVRREMYELYLGHELPAYLDEHARELLGEGRRNFARYALNGRSILASGGETHLLVWRGDRVVSTIAMALATCGLETSRQAMVLSVMADEDTLRHAIKSLAGQPPPDARHLAGIVKNKAVEKWDGVLDEKLLTLSCAARDVDVAAAWEELALIADA